MAPTPGMEPARVNPSCTVHITVTSPTCVILWRGAVGGGGVPTCGAAPGGWGGHVHLRTQVPRRGHSLPPEYGSWDFPRNARAGKLLHPQVRPHVSRAGLAGLRPRGPIRVDGRLLPSVRKGEGQMPEFAWAAPGANDVGCLSGESSSLRKRRAGETDTSSSRHGTR